ncbi:MAG: amidase [Bacteroidota bacterium]
MNRRTFVRNSSLVLLAPLALPAWEMPSCLHAWPAPDDKVDFALNELTIDDLQKKMAQGELTSQAITKLYLDRIEAIDKNGPRLNSVIELNPDALSIAESMDLERKAGRVRGLLHGVPVLIKDNIDTGDKMMTTAGSLAMNGHRAAKDAFIVTRLREAGAVILGKTNLSEWANFRSTRSSSGWSSRGGQTKNPYVIDRNPCGSSSGSGVAVAANFCAVAVGTETNGSIACPSSINGIVGIKPSVGLVSRSGIIPISHTQDTAGPMARTVRDAAILLTVLAGADKNDGATMQSYSQTQLDYTQFLDVNGLQNKRVGVEKSFLKKHEEVDRLLEQALDVLRKKGATIVEVDLMERMKEMGRASYTVLQYEFKDGLNRYLSKTTAPIKSLEELIRFNRLHDAEAMPYFDQEILESSQAKGDLKSKEYEEAIGKSQLISHQAIDSILQENNLDAIAGPTNGPSWCADLVNGDSFSGYGTYSPAAIAGYPHITVPMGYVHGLPVGLTFLSGAFREGQIIQLAYAYEQASKHRVAPAMKNTIQN